jgi:hypothetical protein
LDAITRPVTVQLDRKRNEENLQIKETKMSDEILKQTATELGRCQWTIFALLRDIYADGIVDGIVLDQAFQRLPKHLQKKLNEEAGLELVIED